MQRLGGAARRLAGAGAADGAASSSAPLSPPLPHRRALTRAALALCAAAALACALSPRTLGGSAHGRSAAVAAASSGADGAAAAAAAAAALGERGLLSDVPLGVDFAQRPPGELLTWGVGGPTRLGRHGDTALPLPVRAQRARRAAHACSARAQRKHAPADSRTKTLRRRTLTRCSADVSRAHTRARARLRWGTGLRTCVSATWPREGTRWA
jgi:hypothetical protein